MFEDDWLEAAYEDRQFYMEKDDEPDIEPAPEGHETGIVPIADGWVAECDCGWEGPPRHWRGLCHQDGASHENEMSELL